MSTKTKNVLYWITTIFGPASFVIGGVLNLLRTDDVVANLGHLGYPVYFASILGLWKLLGAITVVLPGLPRLKKLAYAGFFFDLTGAAASHFFVGDGFAQIVAPLVFLALVVASYELRPANRR
jgi:hypothetical protein